MDKSLSSLIRTVIQLPNPAKFFSISVVKIFQRRLPKIRKFQHDFIIFIICLNYSLNFHHVQFANGIRYIILQRFNGKCRRLSCKNFHAFFQNMLLSLHGMGIWYMGNTLISNNLLVRKNYFGSNIVWNENVRILRRISKGVSE